MRRMKRYEGEDEGEKKGSKDTLITSQLDEYKKEDGLKGVLVCRPSLS
jgi:hypothetical protein